MFHVLLLFLGEFLKRHFVPKISPAVILFFIPLGPLPSRRRPSPPTLSRPTEEGNHSWVFLIDADYDAVGSFHEKVVRRHITSARSPSPIGWEKAGMRVIFYR